MAIQGDPMVGIVCKKFNSVICVDTANAAKICEK